MSGVNPGAIVFEQVWKKFRRGERHDSLRDLVPSAIRRLTRGRPLESADLSSHEFWAVHDITFNVQPGEALGIIGPNGAGKSTTLKLLTKILRPTKGRCQVNGRIGALIEVASGFHPDLTGRENVFLQGAIMGMRQSQIREKFDQIVEFSGVRDFIDTQVKRYSSGMNARLGFAIAAHLDPDVMIIDEVLSVGDAAFQEKCIRHMRGMIAGGVPVVFVSHNLPAVLELCTRVIVINRGTVMYDGKPSEAVHYYQSAAWASSAAPSNSASPIRIARVQLLHNGAPSSGVFPANGDATVRISYDAREPVTDPQFVVDINRGDGLFCYGTSTFQATGMGTVIGAGTIDLRLPRLSLLPGAYVISVGIHRTDGGEPYDLHMAAYPFSIEFECRDKGIVNLERRWERVP